ncbi:hypothetical protein V8C86DRAFT_1204876 [Haematococcus lacustris]
MLVQATLAFLAGDKARAKELSRSGKGHTEKMWAAHQEAARLILEARNPGLRVPGLGAVANERSVPSVPTSLRSAAGDLPGVRRQPAHRTCEPDPTFLDLHGLHVSEAVAALEAVVTQRRASAADGGARGAARLTVLTGTGHHSEGPHGLSRLPQAVAKFLAARGLRSREVQPGLIEIDIDLM